MYMYSNHCCRVVLMDSSFGSPFLVLYQWWTRAKCLMLVSFGEAQLVVLRGVKGGVFDCIRLFSEKPVSVQAVY